MIPTVIQRRPIALGTLLLMIMLVHNAAAAQVDDSKIVTALSAGSANERFAALDAIRTVPASKRSESVVGALLAELTRESHELNDRRIAVDTGQSLPPSEDEAEYLFQVLDLVCQHTGDLRIVRPLLPFISTGNRVVNTLADFGERAVKDVNEIASSPSSSAIDAASALLTLERMLRRPSRSPLQEPTRRLIIQTATGRLTGRQESIVVMRAIDLAAATGDLNLLNRVQVMSQDASAVEKLGIAEPALVSSVQERARAVAARGRLR